MASAGKLIGSTGTGAAAGAAFGPMGAGIGAGAGLLAGILFGDDDNSEQAQANLQKAIAQYDQMGVPPDESMPLILQQLKVSGKLTPAYEQALSSENFAPSQINESPEDRQNLMSTLSVLKGMTQGGLNPEQMANAQRLKQQVNANTTSQIQGLLQRQAQQGKGNAGDTLAAQLNAVQSGAQNESQGAADIGAQGFRAQRDALQQLLSGQSGLRSQDIGKATTNAQLQQQANLFKAQNSASRQARNVADTNMSNQANWGRENQVGDTNTLMANQEQARESAAREQNWRDQLALAQGKANAYTGAAGAYGTMANNSNQNFNQALQGVGTLATAYGQYSNNQAKTPTTNNYYGSGNMPKTSQGVDFNNMPDDTQFAAEGGMVQQPDQMNPNTTTPPAIAPVNVNSYGMYAHGGPVNFTDGGHVPGTPKYPGNNYANDVVPAMVSPGEIVIPNTHSHDPEKAKQFVEDEIYKQHAKMHGPVFQRLHERLKKVEGRKGK